MLGMREMGDEHAATAELGHASPVYAMAPQEKHGPKYHSCEPSE